MQAWRRYLPFAALIAVQLVVVLVAPSRSAVSSGGALGGTFNPGTSTNAPSYASGGTTALGSKSSGSSAGGRTSSTGTPGLGSNAGTSSGSSPDSGNTPVTSGSTTASGSAAASPKPGTATSLKPICITGIAETPPCINPWTGTNNGGATSTGVTAKTITVVMYRPAANAAVDTITKATGTYISPAQEQAMLPVVAKWLNSRYELYGRQIVYKYYQGSCDPSPPDDSCFRTDADSLVAKDHPFAVFWDDDGSEAAFFDELARKGVVSWGGWGFSDTFDDSLRPYHYDLFMGGDVQAELAGELWCNELEGGKAVYAGGVLKTETRKAAVVYPDNPQNVESAQHLESIIRGCDPRGAVDAPYSSNTATAVSQATAQATKEKAAGVTDLIWLSDPIAPAFATTAESSQGYQPEEVLAGGQLVDYDALAQTYNSSEWQHAFGLSDLGNAAPLNYVDSGRIWKEEGHSGLPPAASNLMTDYMLEMAGGFEAAGADLTPLNFESGLLQSPGYDSYASDHHNSRLDYVKFGTGDYTAISDVRLVYWNPDAISPINGKKGAYIALHGGERYQLGQIPKGPLQLPASS